MTELAMCLGPRLGAGSFRVGYAKKGCKTRVIKEAIHLASGSFHNWMEWFLWHTAPEEFKPFLSPVIAISQDGKYLEMERAETWSGGIGKIPRALRSIVADIHGGNFGPLVHPKFHGRIVMTDYALVRFPGWNPRGTVAPSIERGQRETGMPTTYGKVWE